MSSFLTSRVFSVDELDDGNIERMYSLFSNYFHANENRFKRDVLQKQWLIFLEDGNDKNLKGFTSIAYLEVNINGAEVRVVYSGDTIIDKKYWNTFELSKRWIKTVLEHNKDNKTPLYWLLLSSGYRTYRFLPTFYKEFYPRYDQITPPELEKLMSTFASKIYGSNYIADQDIVNFNRDSTPLRNGVAHIDSTRMKDPHIAYFLEKNPGYISGNELVCITEIRDDNYTRAGRRMLF